ncbi:hypothetical protein [Kangiella sp. TOML190]|uniref:hypothetical protein n=1 Tax=Kangiella sp. TOML190 TaxID=2931351 RepID=UPI00203A94DD|nr:hypothetical protein [Kangiella sp. TOML190]
MKVEDFEKEALRLLCSDALSKDVLRKAILSPDSIRCEFTGAGYFLDIEHKDIVSNKKIVCSTPIVSGKFKDQEVGFIAFIENGSICLECYNCSDKDMSNDIRAGSFEIHTSTSLPSN